MSERMEQIRDLAADHLPKSAATLLMCATVSLLPAPTVAAEVPIHYPNELLTVTDSTATTLTAKSTDASQVIKRHKYQLIGDYAKEIGSGVTTLIARPNAIGILATLNLPSTGKKGWEYIADISVAEAGLVNNTRCKLMPKTYQKVSDKIIAFGEKGHRRYRVDMSEKTLPLSVRSGALGVQVIVNNEAHDLSIPNSSPAIAKRTIYKTPGWNELPRCKVK